MRAWLSTSILAAPLLLALASCAPKPVAPPAPPPAPAPFVEQPVPEAPGCAKPAEMAAFNMAATKVRLYVLARNCLMVDDYNAFITKNRPALAAHDKALSAYFARTMGKKAVAAKDEYDTGLANAQSQRYGYDSVSACAAAPGYFATVGAVKTVAELNAAAEGLAVSQPMKLAMCK